MLSCLFVGHGLCCPRVYVCVCVSSLLDPLMCALFGADLECSVRVGLALFDTVLVLYNK